MHRVGGAGIFTTPGHPAPPSYAAATKPCRDTGAGLEIRYSGREHGASLLSRCLLTVPCSSGCRRGQGVGVGADDGTLFTTGSLPNLPGSSEQLLLRCAPPPPPLGLLTYNENFLRERTLYNPRGGGGGLGCPTTSGRPPTQRLLPARLRCRLEQARPRLQAQHV